MVWELEVSPFKNNSEYLRILQVPRHHAKSKSYQVALAAWSAGVKVTRHSQGYERKEECCDQLVLSVMGTARAHMHECHIFVSPDLSF